MFERRLKVFVAISVLMLLVCIGRLAQMQLWPNSSLQDAIKYLKDREQESSQFTTIRGRVLDRNGTVLAHDEPRFFLQVGYELSKFLDDRIRRGELLAAGENANEVAAEFAEGFEDVNHVIDKCVEFGTSREDIVAKLSRFNDNIWGLRSFIAWSRGNPDPNLIAEYGLTSVPLSKAMADFELKFPDPDVRLLKTRNVNKLAEMRSSTILLELEEDDDRFVAEFEFYDVNGVVIHSDAQRIYPFGSSAAQTIGWVGPAMETRFLELFEDANDHLYSYRAGEVCGRDGVEYVCEAVLRGRRGEEIIDIDGQLVSHAETEFGSDVSLTLDIHLQAGIEQLLRDPNVNHLYDANCAAVVLDIASGDILSLVSLPSFDLNLARDDYKSIYVDDGNDPAVNRALNRRYPPGSVAKPLILIAALETGAISSDQVIGCPSGLELEFKPDCWIRRQNFGIGHNSYGWQNNARNAIRGSCNIYFSTVAEKIRPADLQKWLFLFGYGHQALPAPVILDKPQSKRNFRQRSGIISSRSQTGTPETLEDIEPLLTSDLRWFGIGQGSLRVTPLQVANAMATIARGGVYRSPRLLLPVEGRLEPRMDAATNLRVSQHTIDVVYDGMQAVVSEIYGTANTVFAGSGLEELGVKVYGKTGSTERPENAWFAGFAVDGAGHELAVAVVVEMGQSGAKDAAPLAREIIRLCTQMQYVGTASN